MYVPRGGEMDQRGSQVQQIAELLPAMRRCADDVRASLPRNSVRALAPIDAVLAAADQLVNGGALNAAAGLSPLITGVLSAAPKQRSLVNAIHALAAFATAIDESSRGDPQCIADQELERARDFSAMSVSRAQAPPTLAIMTARIERLAPGDETELAAIVELLVEHSMRKLVPMVFDRLELEDPNNAQSGAVRTMQRMFRPRVQAFTDLCASLLAAPRAATRRWAIHGLLASGVRPDDVAPLTSLLVHAEPLVRREAANALRAASTWHPQTKSTIADGAREALAIYPDDAALSELAKV